MLTDAQQVTLKAFIIADPVLNAYPNNSDGAWAIAAELNKTAVPDFIVWKTDVPTKDCKKAMVWTEYVGLQQGPRDAWQFMLSNGTINPADVNIRQGIQDIFTPGGTATKAALTAIAKRTATVAEKLFSTGTGSDAVPATMGFEGPLSYQNVQDARNHA